jgi:hypothetical protein
MAWILLLLLPLTLFGQIRFDPVRLDNGMSSRYWYSDIRPEPDGTFLCTWSAWTGIDEYTAYGQRVSATGELIDSTITYEIGDCEAMPMFFHLSDGRRAELFYYG